jgi:hypothetical protein
VGFFSYHVRIRKKRAEQWNRVESSDKSTPALSTDQWLSWFFLAVPSSRLGAERSNSHRVKWQRHSDPLYSFYLILKPFLCRLLTEPDIQREGRGEREREALLYSCNQSLWKTKFPHSNWIYGFQKIYNSVLYKWLTASVDMEVKGKRERWIDPRLFLVGKWIQQRWQ